MKKLIYFSVFFAGLMLVSVSCKKGNLDGPTPVYYSDWITPGPYTQSTKLGVIYYDANISAPRITNDVLNNSVVLVYGKLDGYDPSIWPTDQVSLLPLTLFYQQNSGTGAFFQFTDIWAPHITKGNIDINFTHEALTVPSGSPGFQFRYVIVPGNNHILSTVNGKNYNELKMALKIKD